MFLLPEDSGFIVLTSCLISPKSTTSGPLFSKAMRIENHTIWSIAAAILRLYTKQISASFLRRILLGCKSGTKL